jgi:flagellar protein FliO/FliZ
MKLVICFLFSLFLITPFSVFANTEDETKTPIEKVNDSLSESEIPVHLEAANKNTNAESPVKRMMFSFMLLGVLGCGGFFFLRKYIQNSPNKKSGKDIQVLTQHYLGPKKSLAIIRVAGESILIGVTDQNISLIKSLALLDEEIPQETPKSFKNTFGVFNATADAVKENEEKDEFSISGIKDVVKTRLKSIRGNREII